MADVLLVSKPLAAPWNDGSKNLVRALVRCGSGRYRYRCMVPRHVGAPPPGIAEPIYASPGSYTTTLRQNARVFLRLARPDRAPLYHFFFAPNPRTNRVIAAVMRLKTRRVVHTVASRPNGVVRHWFADVHVALTEDTADELRRAGAPNVRVIPPGIEPVVATCDRATTRARLGLPAQQRCALFAGDLVEGGGAPLFANAVAQTPGVHAVFACRPKGRGWAEMKAALTQRLGPRATFLGEVDDMPSLLAACDVMCFMATNLLAKVDIPLVVLEALALGTPAIVPTVGPLRTLEGEGVMRAALNIDAVASELQRTSLPISRLPTQYRADAMAERYEQIYDEMLG